MSSTSLAESPVVPLRDDDDTLRRKIFWIIVLRTLIITTLFGSLLLAQIVSNEILPIAPLYYLLGATYPLTLLYVVGYRRLGRLQAQAYAQILGDMLFLTGLVYFSGGLLSPFYFLYIIPIITASITLYRKGSLVAASLSGILYGGLVDLMYYGVIPFYGEQRNIAEEVSVGVVYYNIFSSLFGFFAAALLSSYLSENLKRTGAQLEDRIGDLAELRQIHQNIVENLTSGLLTTSLSGGITTINPSGCAILRAEQGELLGSSLGDIVREPSEFFKQLYAELVEKRVIRFEREGGLTGGHKLVMGVTASLLRDREGEPKGFLFNFQDLTEVRRLEAEVRIKDRLAAVGEMAAGIAHEIRNPLASISGSLQVLTEDLHLVGEQQYLLDIVMRESARLDHTLQDFLDYARPRQVAVEQIDLVEIARETIALMMHSHELGPDHRIQLSGCPSAPFVGDRSQWVQVFWNLLKNAVKAMPLGGTLDVGILPEETSGHRLVFRDQGVGMSEQEARRAGEAFYSAFSRGTGLGMAIVNRIVQDHEGRMEIRSRKGEGTEIVIHLPARAPDVVEEGRWR